MADAAPEPVKDRAEPPVIRREDYRPFDWLVPETRLDFALGLDRTRVTATLKVERNPAGVPTGEIRLDGDGLTPLEVAASALAQHPHTSRCRMSPAWAAAGLHRVAPSKPRTGSRSPGSHGKLQD